MSYQDELAGTAEYISELESDAKGYRADVERLEAELNDVRSDLAVAEAERDEYRGAITAHKQAIRRTFRQGNEFDGALWAVLDQ